MTHGRKGPHVMSPIRAVPAAPIRHCRRVPTDPIDIVVALGVLLGAGAEVSLDRVGEKPFAVLKMWSEGECWVDLAVSIGAFPSSTADEIAHAIAESEGWV